MEGYIQYTIIAIAAIVILFNFNGLLRWFRPSFEDGQGTASYKRLTAFTLLVTDCYMVYFNRITNGVTLYTHYSLLMAMLLVSAIITTENVLTLARLIKGGKEDPATLKDGDTVIIDKK